MSDASESFALIAFGDIIGPERTITSGAIFDALFAKGEWYTTRATRLTPLRTRVVFYQNATGFRGTALVVGIVESVTTHILGCSLYLPFKHRLSLGQCKVFAEPLNMRPMVNVLDFVSNKKYWGQSLRSTPRPISQKDYLTIMAAVQFQDEP